MTYTEFCSLLQGIGFDDFYQNEISNRNYRIDYGSRKGALEFISVKDAAKQYTYDSTDKYMVKIDQQLPILNSSTEINEHELILQCIEVFDWGGVQTSNIIDAINLHRQNKLSSYLLTCKNWFEDDNTIVIENFDPIWSSGWTKIYSFMFNKTAIYDSRVSAFINMVMLKFYQHLATEIEREELLQVSNKLLSFPGTASRKRCVSKADRLAMKIRMKSPNGQNSFVANKLASWLLRYISEIEFSASTQQHFRELDKAAFMLGFDIDQISPELRFQ